MVSVTEFTFYLIVKVILLTFNSYGYIGWYVFLTNFLEYKEQLKLATLKTDLD